MKQPLDSHGPCEPRLAMCRTTCTLLVLAMVGIVALLAPACDAANDNDPASTTRQEPPDTDEMQGAVASMTPTDMRTSLARLAWAAQMPAASNPERDTHRVLLARGAIDAWLYSRMADLMARTSAGEDPDVHQRWLDELNTWSGIVSIVAPRSRRGEAGPPGTRLARRLRPMLRPLLRDAVHGADASLTLRILDVAAATDRAARLRAGHQLLEALQDDGNELDQQLALRGWMLLALEGAEALITLPGVAPGEQPLELALDAGLGCADGIAELAEGVAAGGRGLTPRRSVEVLRQRCDFACTDASLLGLRVPTSLPEIEPELDVACAVPALDRAPEGHHLSVDAFLVSDALASIATIRDGATAALAAARGSDGDGDDNKDSAKGFARLAAPFAQAFVNLVDATVVPGHIPFLAPEGPTGVTLPTVHHVLTPLAPTQAILVVRGETLRVAAWPRYRVAEDGQVESAATGTGLDFPGREIASSGSADVMSGLRDALAEVRTLPWHRARGAQTHNERDDVVTVVVDVSTDVRQLQRALAWLRDAGATRITLAAWPREDGGTTTRPLAAGLALRIDRPEKRAPLLRLADRETELVDTLGRARELPIFALRRHLPDVYAAVLRYARAHPAIRELVIDVEPTLAVTDLVAAIDALRFHRQGDVMSSTEALMRAPLLERPGHRAVPLMQPLHLQVE